jgi:thymidylate synthase (FAD)
MKLINSSFEIIEQKPGLEGIYKQIELAGRTCYKSESNITEDSAKAFVDRMIKSGHGAMLEHGAVYLYKYVKTDVSKDITARHYNKNPYSHLHIISDNSTGESHVYITTNYRVLIEHNWLDDLQYLCEPTEYHEKRVTVRFICPISISREFNRHRANSMAEQSTRYCNYSKDKFDNEITFIKPYWYDDVDSYTKNEFDRGLQYAEGYYMFLIDKGMKAQEAREILPLCTATELVHTAFVDDWKHFFFLRDAAPAHPQARELAEPLHKEFINRGYINGSL